MKATRNILLVLLMILTIQSCQDKRYATYIANVPIYLSFEDLRKTVEAEAPVDIVNPGKIYFKDQYIYINEYMEGVHIVDISDPSNPTEVAYLPVPGNVDMAIKGDILYLDNYTDLVKIDISDPENPVDAGRIEDVLEYTIPAYNYDYPMARIDEEEGVVTGWEIKEYTEEIYYNPYPYPIYFAYGGFEDALLSSSSVRTTSSSGSAYGIGGSMARFLTYDNYLYMLETSNMLKVADISDEENISIVYDDYVGWGLETMFIYDDYLYLGSTNGMYIMDLSDPKNPVKKSLYSHITSCDPVVVNGNTAYVTLRSGTTCGGTADLLDVINVSNKSNPTQIASYTMTTPYGLGISGSTLFICRGDKGMVVYDATDSRNIDDHKLAEFTSIKATDVIPVDSVLFMIGEGGFYIYDYSDLNDITQIGNIPVVSE